MANEIWLGKFAYLADIFSRFNDLILSNILCNHNKMDGFKKKAEFMENKSWR